MLACPRCQGDIRGWTGTACPYCAWPLVAPSRVPVPQQPSAFSSGIGQGMGFGLGCLLLILGLVAGCTILPAVMARL